MSSRHIALSCIAPSNVTRDFDPINMSPTMESVSATGDNIRPVVPGSAMNGTSAQASTDSNKTDPYVGKTVTGPATEDDPVRVRGKLQTMNERFRFEPEESKLPKKKKKKNNNFMNRGPTALLKNRGTGFEDFFCDPPMTPAEAEEEKNELYSPERPFVDRIEECIQRYRARRRMDNVRSTLFDKYLALGGIDTSPRMFQGKRSLDVSEASSSQIENIAAADVIHRDSAPSRYYSPSQDEQWEVDFSGVVAGYFSERIFKLAGTELSVIKTAADVLENFLNYVLHHDVCPEFADDVRKAKAICQESPDQITRCFRVTCESPGDFNIACLTLFDHGKRKVFDPDSTSVRYTMPVHQAQRVFYASVAVHSFLFHKFRGKPLDSIEVVDEVKQAFEVLEICEPSDKQAQAYLGVKDMKGETGGIKPCGKLTLRPVDIQDGYDKGSASGAAPGIGDVEEFALDWTVLEPMTIGMKLKLAICILDNGFKFIKACVDVRPRYYTFLPQELMLSFKEPVPNEREAPSVMKPDIGVEDAADAKLAD